MPLTVLVTNDDGVNAPGLAELVSHLVQLEEVEVFVVAPSREWSARGHAITIHEPLYVHELDYDRFYTRAWEATGSPADCVKLGLNLLVNDGRGVDMVISGINNGPNLATDVLYSGTVAAAIEAALAGVPALAVSLSSRSDTRSSYSLAARTAQSMVQVFGDRDPAKFLLNVNVPARSPESIRGIKFTELGTCPYEDLVEMDCDAQGRDCYWLKVKRLDEAACEGSDLAAIADGYISVTPLNMFDITDRSLLRDLETLADEIDFHLNEKE